ARGSEEGEQAAQTIAHGADLAGATCHGVPQIVDRCLDVLDAGVLIETPHQIEGAFPLRVCPVRQLHARLEPPEQIGRKREIAARREFVGDLAHHPVDAEDLLDDDEAGSASGCGRSEIGGELAVRAALDPYVLTAHRRRSAYSRQLALLARPEAPRQARFSIAAGSPPADAAVVGAFATGSPDW